MQAIEGIMERMLLQQQNCAVVKAAEIIEAEFALPCGVGLQLFKHLVLSKRIDVDISCKLNLMKGITVS
jgi:hypothetical protein